MPELIDRQAALEKMCGDCKSGYDGHCPHPFGMCHEYESILQVPTIEAEPVRRGRWDNNGTGSQIFPYLCTSCNESSDYPYPYCPICGARMDGGAEND